VKGAAKVTGLDEAMGQYASGDARAFETVYEGVAPRLERYVRRHLRDRARVQDLLQQTFLQMHRARGTFIVGAEVMPWAFAIAYRLMLDLRRKNRHEEPWAMTEDDGAWGQATATLFATGEQLLEAEQTKLRLAAAYASLSELQRAAFDLVKVEGLTLAEAASILGTTVTGIKLRLHRSVMALRAAVPDPPRPVQAGTHPPRRAGFVAARAARAAALPMLVMRR
jgi:RNA polymerase sigma-70 factor (ECF subfamily)